jgi:hypothetical protein
MFASLATCCSSKFGWIDSDRCAALTTGASTTKWYVDYQSNTCKQGWGPDLSMQYFSSAATCCSTKLGWVQASTCTGANAGGTAGAGSNKWYVDWSIGKCAKDCAVSGSDAQCGGLAEAWKQATFTSWQVCCDAKLPWVKDSECHLG